MQDNPAKKKPAYSPRVCGDCGVLFTPNCSRSKRCPDCQVTFRKAWIKQRNTDYYQRNQQELVEYAARYRAERPEEHRAASLRWSAANPESKRVNDAAWRERNRATLRVRGREASRAWRASMDPEELRARNRARFAANPEKAREAQRRYFANHPEARSVLNARRRMRVNAQMTPQDKLLSRLYRKAIKSDPCFYCGSAETHEVDHYFPLAKGGTDHWWNLVRSCSFCNRSKKDRCGTVFLLRSGAFAARLPDAA